MDSSESHLDRIEAQRSANHVSPEQWRQRYTPSNLISKSLRTLTSRGFLGAGEEDMIPHTEVTEPVQDFFINLRFSDLFDLPGEYVPMNVRTFRALSNGNHEHLEQMKRCGTPMACFKNDKGDSIFHLAAAWGHVEVVKSIVSECPCLLLEPNLKDQLPLHLAARAGHSDVVDALVTTLTFVSSTMSDERLNLYVLKDRDGHTALHLALKRCHMVTTFLLVNANKHASFLANKNGISPLYLAVESRDVPLVKGVCNLLGRSTKNVYVCDDDGSFPIHMAAKNSHVNIVKKVLEWCPDAKHLLNKEDQDLLHVAANSMKSESLRHLMMSEEIKHLANEQDVDGNTPLHLATIKWRPQTVLCLMRRENHLIQNNINLTALDIAELNLQPHYIFREVCRIFNHDITFSIISLLVSCNPWFDYSTMKANMAISAFEPWRKQRVHQRSSCGCSSCCNCNIYSMFYNARLDGFKSSTPNLGMANLITDFRLIIFFIYDIIAMQLSIVALVCLILAQLGDPALFNSSLKVALPTLLLALVAMAYSFFFASVVAAGHVIWLIILLIIFNLIFAYVMFFILAPHFFLEQTVNRGELGKFLIGLLMFVDEDEDESNQTSAHKYVKRVESVGRPDTS